MISTLLVCLVVGISDGDSLTVTCGPADAAAPRQVRIHAIDAPERYQSFSDASRSSLSDLCMNARVRILRRDTDVYGRTVGQVECRGEDAGEHQVSTGLAWAYARHTSPYFDHLLTLQEQARLSRRGLWVDPQPMAPWIWRRH